MYPNPSAPGQFINPNIGSALPAVPIRYPPAMIKSINNNHPLTTMASPFFVDNLLQHQKAVNFQSQFVNSQLHSYIQEQHHQFMMHQSQLRHQQALKYAASNLQESYLNNEELNRKNSLERLNNFSPQHNSRANTPNSNEQSPRVDYDDDEDNDERLRLKRNSGKEVCDVEGEDSKILDVESDSVKKTNCDSEKKPSSRSFEDNENREDNSHSEEDRFTEDSPVGSPLNNGVNTVKNEYQLSPTSFAHQGYFGNNFQQERREKYGEESKKDDRSGERRKDDYNDDADANPNNDSDPEVNRVERERLKSPCAYCGSYDCNPFFPSCRGYSAGNLGLARFEGIERRISNNENTEPYGSPIRSDISMGDDRMMKDGHLEMMKRTSLDGGHPAPQKPVLKFSVSAILGNDQSNDGDRSAGASIMKIGHHEGFAVHGGGVFALPGFPIAKPIASRPPSFPPHLHSLLAHCRQHPYLTVGGGGGGPVFIPAGGAGPFPWAGGARGKPRRGMMRRAVFSDTQRRGLERRFQLQKYISKPDRKKLAEKLGLKDSQVKIWFQNRRMKWRNSKERELLASGGSREQTLPNKNNPHPDLSDAETDRPKLSPMSPASPGQEQLTPESENVKKNNKYVPISNNQFDAQFDGSKLLNNEDGVGSYRHYVSSDGSVPAGNNSNNNFNGGRSYSLMAADDAMADDYDSENGSGSDEEINVT